MERYLKAFAAAILAGLTVWGADINLIDGLSKIFEVLLASAVNGGLVWAVPNKNYPDKPVTESRF